jgi:hypothetical protein
MTDLFRETLEAGSRRPIEAFRLQITLKKRAKSALIKLHGARPTTSTVQSR